MGVAQTPQTGSSGGGAPGKAVFSTLNFNKRIDGNTPLFQQYIEAGTALTKGFILTVLNQADGTTSFARTVHSFGNAYIQSQQLAADDGQLSEAVTITFGLVGITYNTQTSSGSLGQVFSTCWNAAQGVGSSSCLASAS